uniref:Uncharacterized protein n=1 Tax=Globisporangium ultimum (strain ATCC 200006 / CBS 805.95 / DAOM BR144) TaxID=431595 RepID=K3WK46_GLOUD
MFKPQVISKQKTAVFHVCGRLRQFALFAIGAMGLWPLLLQVIMVPESVFGDGHGDRYEQVSYFAFENDHYQVLTPRKVDCGDLQTALFGGKVPVATQDLLRAVSDTTFKTARTLVINQTTDSNATTLSVSTGILGLAKDRSVCFGGVDDEGSVQVEALLSAQEAAAFGVDSACLQGSATHMRLRLQSSEFFSPDTMGELNPARVPGAMLIVSLVDEELRPVLSSCYGATRETRYKATQIESEYRRLVSVYSKQLLVSETCNSFTLFGGSRDEFGCAFSALGASGAVADLNSDGAQRTYSFTAPWRMIQCTVAGECSSLLFTQMWLSEWTVQDTTSGEVLRHNFVNHKVNEVTVDNTFSLRLLISLQILALVVTAYLTSVRGWYTIQCAIVSPWAKVANATTSCTIAKVVRSSYNFILVAQMVLGIIQWRKQLTVDMLVGADTNQAVLRATGCGTLVVVLAINIVFARAGDLKMQEMEPSFAHVVGFVAAIILYLVTRSSSIGASARSLLVNGMHTVAAAEVTQYSGCRGSSVCAAQASLQKYIVVLVLVITIACATGSFIQAALQASARVSTSRRISNKTRSKNALLRKESLNSFTRFLDDRSQKTDMYDSSTEIYVRMPGGTVLSTRGQLEACGFVPAASMLFRYRDLPQFLGARALPMQVLNLFNLTVTIYELMETGEVVNGHPVMYVADQVIHAHWSKLKGATLSWSLAYYGGDDREHRFSTGLAKLFRPSSPRYVVAAET